MEYMKKHVWKYFLPVAALMFAALSAQAQDTEERLAPVYELRDTLVALIPFHDAGNQLTIQRAMLDVDYKFMRMTIAMDSGAVLQEPDWYLDYLTHHSRWSFVPLGELGFDLHLTVTTPKGKRKGSGGSSYTFTSQDILQALQPPLWQQAREYVGAYARHVASTLPHMTGEGETMAGCRYDEQARVMTTTFDYAAGMWPEVKQYLEENLGAVRKERARALVADTVTSIAFAAYKGDVTLRYVFRSQPRTDSVEMVIPPWMWESVYNPGAGSMSDTLMMIQYIADEVNKQCPTAIDSTTTLASCTFDTAARRMVYTYMVDESTLRNLTKSSAALQALQQSVEKAFLSTAGKALGKYVVAAGVRVEYHYVASPSGKPVVVSVMPERIKELLR